MKNERLRRLHVPALPEAGGEVSLPLESVRHAKVLRLRAGDELTLFDGRGREARARLTLIDREGGACVTDPPSEIAARAPRVHLLVGLPKGDKLETIVRMVTELGVDALTPVLCERSVARGFAASSPRMQRLQRIAIEACAQSGQARAVALCAPRPLEEAALEAPAEASKLVFWERAQTGIGELGDRREVWAVVGPEGGLPEREVSTLRAAGYYEAGLGEALLRVETATIAVATLILQRVGRIG